MNVIAKINCYFKHSVCIVTLKLRKQYLTRKVAIIAMYCHLRPPDAIAFPT